MEEKSAVEMQIS